MRTGSLEMHPRGTTGFSNGAICTRRLGWLAAVLLALSGACAAGADKPAPVTISKQTTFFTAPVRSDGTIDYPEAINQVLGKGVTAERNAAVPLLEMAALAPGANVAHYDKVRAKLGLPPAKPPTGDAAAGDAVGAFAGADPAKLDLAMRGPWTAGQAPEVAAWLKALEPRLKLFVEASRRDQFYMPLVRERDDDGMILILLPHLAEQRMLVNALVARAMLALGNEDGEAFRRDAVAIVRVGRLTTRASTMLERFVGIHCELPGLAAIQVAASGGWLSGGQVERLLADLRAAPDGLRLHEVFDLAERACVLEVLQHCAAHGPADVGRFVQGIAGKLPPVEAAAGRDQWDAALRRANGWYDRMHDAGRKPNYAQRLAEIGALQGELAGPGGDKVTTPVAPEVFARRVLAELMSSLRRADTVETGLQVDRAMTQVALALSAVRAKTGEYPAALKELVPAYLASEPLDLFTGRALVYRAEGGGYVLQSLGANGQDDTGSVGARNDDRVIRAER
jgi:hypothetical protein